MFDLGLKDKVAIVAGGGASKVNTTVSLKPSSKVTVADMRSSSLADNTGHMINRFPEVVEALGIRGDLTQSNQCKKVVDLALNNWGRLIYWIINWNCK